MFSNKEWTKIALRKLMISTSNRSLMKSSKSNIDPITNNLSDIFVMCIRKILHRSLSLGEALK